MANRLNTGYRMKRRSASRTIPPDRTAALLDQVGLALLTGVLILVPLAGGGRAEFGKSFYVASVWGLFVFCCWRQAQDPKTIWRWTVAEWLLLAGFLLLVLQIFPWSHTALLRLSPRLSHWLPMWCTDAVTADGSGPAAKGSAQWCYLSLTPHATSLALQVYTAHVLLFISVALMTHSLECVRRLIRFVAIASTSMAVLGLVQYLSQTDKFAWVLVHPSRKASAVACGPFANANHFAHFLALGLPSLICWLHEHLLPEKVTLGSNRYRFQTPINERGASVWCLGSALCLVLIAALFSRSRGGVLVMTLGALTCVGLMTGLSMLQRQLLWPSLALTGLVGLGLYIHGGQELGRELRSLVSGSWQELDQGNARWNLWQANFQVAREFPYFGTGVGSHAAVYPLFMPHKTEHEYTHAESCYVQLLTETGWVGLGLSVMGLCLIGVWLLRSFPADESRTRKYCWIAVTSSLLVSVVHALFDFPWYLTSCMSLSVVLVGAARGLASLPSACSPTDTVPGTAPQTKHPESWKWSLAAGVAAMLFFPVVMHIGRWGRASLYWNEYLVLALDPEYRQNPLLLAAENSEQRAREEEAYRHQQMLQALAGVLRWAPEHPEANLRMARLQIKLFDQQQMASENAIGLQQIAEAVYASSFADSSARDVWLDRVLGPNRKRLDVALTCCNRGLRGSPLEGMGYATLSSLAFLIDLEPSLRNRFLDQAYRLRPHEPSILLVRGEQLLQQGDLEGTLNLWRNAFRQDIEFSQTIMQAVAPMIGGERFMTFFDPNERQLRTLADLFYKLHREEEAAPVLRRIMERIRERLPGLIGEEAAEAHLEIVRFCRQLADRPQALREAEAAVQSAPNHFDSRIALAMELIHDRQFDQAVSHLAWCAKRRPQEKLIHELHDVIRRERLRQQVHAAQRP